MTKLLLFVIFGWLVWLAWYFVWKKPAPNIATELPPELMEAKIWAKERDFECGGAIPLRGRTDEIFQNRDGSIIVTETKTRNKLRVYSSDILQLSGYKVLIEHHTSRQVSSTGYVRVLSPEGNEYIAVDLLPRDEVQAARQLHEDLTSGLYVGEKCKNPVVCKTCAYVEPCTKIG